MKYRILLALIVTLAAPTAVTHAEQQIAPGPQHGPARNFDRDRGHPGPGDDENARKRIEAIRISRLTEALKLDEKAAAKFIPAITVLDQKRLAAMRDHRAAMLDLRNQLRDEKTDSAHLKETIERYMNNRREMMKLREQEFETARQHLTTEQLARYLVFQQDFMREIRDLVSGMRGDRRDRGGPGPRPGRGPGPDTPAAEE